MKTILLKELKSKKTRPEYVTIIIQEGVYDIYQCYYWEDKEKDYVIYGDNNENNLQMYSHLFRDFSDNTVIIPKYMVFTRNKVRKTKEEKEIERLHSIIKEVREYIENSYNGKIIVKEELLGILDKVDKE